MADLDPQDRRQSAQPAFNAPVVVLGLALAILGVQVFNEWSLSGTGYGHAVLLWLGAVRTGASLEQLPAAPLFGLSPYVLHVFVHFGWMHTLVNLGALVAFGAPAARAFGRGFLPAFGFLMFFFACAIGGGALSAVVHAGEASLMVGASTAVSGLVPAAGWAVGGRTMMLRLALPWLAINIALAFGEVFVGHNIAWEGHVGGILVGMIAYPTFVKVLGASARRI